MRYQTILFDVDGTLVDSERPVKESYRATLLELGKPDPGSDLLEIAMRDTSEKALLAADISDIAPACRVWAKHLKTMMAGRTCIPGIPELLRALDASGVKLGLVTSRVHEEVDVDASIAPLLPLFRAQVCVEDAAFPKPHPAPMLRAMELLNADPSTTLYVGDSPTDAISAHAAGIDFALALWGYRPGDPIRAEHYLVRPEDLIAVQRAENTKWLRWAQELQFIAQAGLAYSRDPFDLERFGRIRELSAEIMREGTGMEIDRIADLFCSETGFQTPKLDTRAALFDGDAILLVRERDGRWALPGGWVDVNHTICENAIKEVYEEAGLEAEFVKLIAVQDRNRHNRPLYAYGITKVFVLCRSTGGCFRPNTETTEAAWFTQDSLPPLSVDKTTAEQIRMCFAARSDAWQPPVD